MATQVKFPQELCDVRHLNQELVRWLSSSSPGETLGDSHEKQVAAVSIGGERCYLVGQSTREGVAEYLRRVLDPSAFYSVAASSKGVVHRVTVGDCATRIHGFYLYTSRYFEQPRAIATADGSPYGYGWKDLAFTLFDAVALLHSRGHQRLHVIPTQGDLGWHFQVAIAEGVDYGAPFFPMWREGSLVFSWSSAAFPRVGKLAVGPTTSLSSVAREIIAHSPDDGLGIDWAYAGWYAELLAEAHQLGELPASDVLYDMGPDCWELGYGTGVPYPPPPVSHEKVGYTDAFPQSRIDDSIPIAIPSWSDTDITKRADFEHSVLALFEHEGGPLAGLYAATPQAFYRRDHLVWNPLKKRDFGELNRAGFLVSYRFIKAYDILEARGERPDWALAQRMRLFKSEPEKPAQE